MKWKKLLKHLDKELDEGYDPLYEETSAGSKLLGLCYEVEKELDLYLEPSIQGGSGGIWIYSGFEDADGGCLAEDIDYRRFNSDCIGLAFESSSADEFKIKYSDYLESIIASAH